MKLFLAGNPLQRKAVANCRLTPAFVPSAAALESRGPSGSAIVVVLVFTTVCLIILLGLLGWVTSNARLTQRHCQYNRALAAAEAATEKVLTAISTDYKNQGQGYVLTNMSHYRDMYPTAAEDPAWANYSFMDVSGQTNRTHVGYTPSTNCIV